MRMLRPGFTSLMPSSTPAYDILNWLNCRGTGFQIVCSLRWRTSRNTFIPHTWSFVRGNRSCLNGIACSMTKPSAWTLDRHDHTPSQFWLMFRPSS